MGRLRGILLVGLGSALITFLPLTGTTGTASAAPSQSGAAPATARRDPSSRSCLVCHGDPAITSSARAPEAAHLYVAPGTFVGSAHASLSCLSCHTALPAQVSGHGAVELQAARASCGRCHRPEASQLSASAHAPGRTGRATGSVPTCVTCHGGHDVLPVHTAAFARLSDRRCSSCHRERGQSFFERNYHGKEAMLGRSDVATCASCHRAHLVLAPSDPRSSVATANLLGTCRQCHPKAPAHFAGIEIHVAGGLLPADPKLRAVTLYMMAILVGTFGFFGVHTALAIRHSWKVRRPSGEPRRGAEP